MAGQHRTARRQGSVICNVTSAVCPAVTVTSSMKRPGSAGGGVETTYDPGGTSTLNAPAASVVVVATTAPSGCATVIVAWATCCTYGEGHGEAPAQLGTGPAVSVKLPRMCPGGAVDAPG